MAVVVDPPEQEPTPPQISVEVSDGGGGGNRLHLTIHVEFDPSKVKFNTKKSHAGKFSSGAGWHRWTNLDLPPNKTKVFRGLRKATRRAKVVFLVVNLDNGKIIRRTLTLKKHP